MTESERANALFNKIYPSLPDAIKESVEYPWQAVLLAAEPYFNNLCTDTTFHSLSADRIEEMPEILVWSIMMYMRYAMYELRRVSVEVLKTRFGLSDKNIISIMASLRMISGTENRIRFLAPSRMDSKVEQWDTGLSTGQMIAEACSQYQCTLLHALKQAQDEEVIGIEGFVGFIRTARMCTEELMKNGGTLPSTNSFSDQSELNHTTVNCLLTDTITLTVDGRVGLNPRNPMLIPERILNKIKVLEPYMYMEDIESTFSIPSSDIAIALETGITLEMAQQQYKEITAGTQMITPKRVTRSDLIKVEEPDD